MSKKLLNKTTANFLVFAVVILLISAPLCYLIVEQLYIAETDETLRLHKEEFTEYYQKKFDTADVQNWNKYNRNIRIMPFNGIEKDTLVDMVYYDKLENENEPYRELRGTVTIKNKRYSYLERINLIEKEDMVLSIAAIFLLVIGILLTGIIYISKRLSSKLWKPFYDTLNQIRDFEIDKNKAPQFAATDTEEFDSLNKSIARLIEKNTAIYKGQREFIENAAHELQTPLALFQSKIDALSQLPETTKDQFGILETMHKDVARFNRLNKNLLLLSKIDNVSAPEKQNIVINDYVAKNIAFFEEQAKAKHLTITTRFSSTVEAESNPELVEILINNLFLNAIRHNIKDGQIIITIADKSLLFRNSGIQQALPIDKLFNRFSKTDPSSKGNGLGLAIIKKIANSNQWEISYSFEDNLHGFLVRF
ncbi:sensor histidine kinase [Flavobacterium sp. 3HN19-14]|uniref:sensor histidine kinase n=1 Tax=Flavobacterium sp. 3HN19-14 TaxID=3448133 RepID=UPI003EE095CD